MDVREMGSVRWVLKGRDGAWRRWVVRDEEEMMMGCCVRETAARGAWGLCALERSDPGASVSLERVLPVWKTMFEEGIRRVLRLKRIGLGV
ncbi:hypothetical protein MRB53_002298 [Persea americana]|uniref:Uncharacterized protein n=1 Tax=Persea americana TaxID=3435 RepID=A0ACC2MUD4_PERAE|nr:hypothetical protein MRB53_002298 [Persea americana]